MNALQYSVVCVYEQKIRSYIFISFPYFRLFLPLRQVYIHNFCLSLVARAISLSVLISELTFLFSFIWSCSFPLLIAPCFVAFPFAPCSFVCAAFQYCSALSFSLFLSFYRCYFFSVTFSIDTITKCWKIMSTISAHSFVARSECEKWQCDCVESMSVNVNVSLIPKQWNVCLKLLLDGSVDRLVGRCKNQYPHDDIYIRCTYRYLYRRRSETNQNS